MEFGVERRRAWMVPQNFNDLWILDKIIRPGDEVTAIDFRTEKKEGKQERRRLKIRMKVEKKALEHNKLRLIGKIVFAEPEDFVSLGSYHSFEISPGKKIWIERELDPAERELLEEAKKQSKLPDVLIVSLDESEAEFYLLSQGRLRFLFKMSSETSKRSADSLESFLGRVAGKIKEWKGLCIVGGPGFAWQTVSGLAGVRGVRTSMAGIVGAREIVREHVPRLLKEEISSKIERCFEEFLEHLGKDDGLCAYGEEVYNAAEIGAVEVLLVSEEYFEKHREKVLELMKKVERTRGRFFLVPSDTYTGKRLKGFGLAAVLRFRIR